MTTTLTEMYEITVLLRRQHQSTQDHFYNLHKENPQQATKEVLTMVHLLRLKRYLRGVLEN